MTERFQWSLKGYSDWPFATCYIQYINDLSGVVKNGAEVCLYADDTIIFRRIKEPEDCTRFQEDINEMKGGQTG